VFLRTFLFAAEEREGQIQTGGGSVQEMPGTGHLDLCCTVVTPRAVTGKPISGHPVNTKKTIESMINS
jgi:hypothetical protein